VFSPAYAPIPSGQATEIRVTQILNEVHVIFTAASDDQASELADRIARQLALGALNIMPLGKPSKAVKS
jgi:hypothetical protein